jgi:hypothetical protein
VQFRGHFGTYDGAGTGVFGVGIGVGGDVGIGVGIGVGGDVGFGDGFGVGFGVGCPVGSGVGTPGLTDVPAKTVVGKLTARMTGATQPALTRSRFDSSISGSASEDLVSAFCSSRSLRRPSSNSTRRRKLSSSESSSCLDLSFSAIASPFTGSYTRVFN